ncbi:50S ribosomal protein L21e [Candidatus Woesearchaeota archaeon]|nr:50S ribosomal protein L21e [Candidatus Woesearchaeota archaeon]
MAQRIGRSRRKTRDKLKKHYKQKGKISIRNYLQEFKAEERVILKAEPAVQTGMYFPRFHGKVGIVKGKQGDCYKVKIKDFKKPKILLIHPVHLKKWQA